MWVPAAPLGSPHTSSIAHSQLHTRGRMQAHTHAGACCQGFLPASRGACCCCCCAHAHAPAPALHVGGRSLCPIVCGSMVPSDPFCCPFWLAHNRDTARCCWGVESCSGARGTLPLFADGCGHMATFAWLPWLSFSAQRDTARIEQPAVWQFGVLASSAFRVSRQEPPLRLTGACCHLWQQCLCCLHFFP